ncbi:MAG: hypothetical protein WCF85_06265 [Rhodospirillaceae bacterium]
MAKAEKTTDERLSHIEEEVVELRDEMSELKTEMKEVKHLLTQVLQMLSRIDGRMDEQRSTINALIPVRLAAVPSAAA